MSNIFFSFFFLGIQLLMLCRHIPFDNGICPEINSSQDLGKKYVQKLTLLKTLEKRKRKTANNTIHNRSHGPSGIEVFDSRDNRAREFGHYNQPQVI